MPLVVNPFHFLVKHNLYTFIIYTFHFKPILHLHIKVLPSKDGLQKLSRRLL